MASIPIWFTAPQGGVAVTIIKQDVDAAGVLSDRASGSQTLTGFLDSFTYESNPEHERIEHMAASRGNNVIILENNRITFAEIMRKAGTTPSILKDCALTADYFKVTIVRAGKTMTYYGVRGAYSEPIVRGKTVVTLSLEMIDPGSANPTEV